MPDESRNDGLAIKDLGEQNNNPLLTLLEETSNQTKLPEEFKTVGHLLREERIAEAEIDIDALLKQSAREHNFYNPLIPLEYRTVSAHTFLFESLPHRPKSYEGEYPLSAKRQVEIIRLMEQLKPPSTRDVLFESGDSVLATEPQTFEISDSRDLRLSARAWRPNSDKVWDNSRYWAGHRPFNDIETTYHLDLALVDSDGKVSADLASYLPKGAGIVIGSEVSADPIDMVAVFPKDIKESDLNRMLIVDLFHEMGHLEQFVDEEFRTRFRQKLGKDIEAFPGSHPMLEEDAWTRAVSHLRKIEQQTGRSILPDGWEGIIQKRLDGYKAMAGLQ